MPSSQTSGLRYYSVLESKLNSSQTNGLRYQPAARPPDPRTLGTKPSTSEIFFQMNKTNYARLNISPNKAKNTISIIFMPSTNIGECGHLFPLLFCKCRLYQRALISFSKDDLEINFRFMLLPKERCQPSLGPKNSGRCYGEKVPLSSQVKKAQNKLTKKLPPLDYNTL